MQVSILLFISDFDMKRWDRKLFSFYIAFFLLILCLPILQKIFDILPKQELKGYTYEKEFISLGMHSWWSGSFQKNFTNWFSDYIGFRGYMVKLDNELNLRIFREISASTQTKIVLGKDHQLYEKGYIDGINNKDWVSSGFLHEEAKKIITLQNKLKARGITLEILIAPSKATIYPEFIPEKYTHISEHKKTNYDRMITFLEDEGIHVFDANRYFLERKESNTYPFFTRSGTHWNYYAACLVSEELLQQISEYSNKKLGKIVCEPVSVDNIAYGTDRDLLDVINIWNQGQFLKDIPHPTIKFVSGEDSLDKILWVGDSFSWTVLSIFEKADVYKKRNMYYYYSREFIFPSGEEKRLDRENIDWDEVFSHEVIVIEATQTAMNSIGFGFVDAALKHLE
ncbi:MAG: hypothetical protein COV59_05590 [Candidatus Magasanikbacteria bacterium CG11_big_fil_rev_8_21_14_0_20_39_34]|uniref:AlgX/AlgJ SGNH hydrolase-like domain-containing protein n=1 Tax=Candidatus Magasanikbacteria bacterium CG11_big_fil_rev_8_21_14_0_20_39_34 TaxID=1974653 RepID=A0A2H0N426_9BACT|nr:MAG: hypothetical protein COV59_05590 [Candidatus Magasanikbacteria bacterium CG11_big_fil_rev_8_21_14_0_20_39_34]